MCEEAKDRFARFDLHFNKKKWEQVISSHKASAEQNLALFKAFKEHSDSPLVREYLSYLCGPITTNFLYRSEVKLKIVKLHPYRKRSVQDDYLYTLIENIKNVWQLTDLNVLEEYYATKALCQKIECDYYEKLSYFTKKYLAFKKGSQRCFCRMWGFECS